MVYWRTVRYIGTREGGDERITKVSRRPHRIRDFLDLTGLAWDDTLVLTLDGTYDESFVGGLGEDFLSVERVE